MGGQAFFKLDYGLVTKRNLTKKLVKCKGLLRISSFLLQGIINHSKFNMMA